MEDRRLTKNRTAIVLAGGGSRGAYEAGVIHYIRTKLPPKLAHELVFHILCGSSVGGINSTFMASTANDPHFQGEQITHLWRALRTKNIYRRGPATLGKLILRSGVGLGSHFIGLKGVKEADDVDLHFRGLFDTAPFLTYLRGAIPWKNISRNLENGHFDMLAISATNMLTGALEFFLQKNPHTTKIGSFVTREVRLTPRHVAASAAIPILFPPVSLYGSYYNDGGLRLNTPLSPAVAMGASRILIIGTRYRSQNTEDTLTRLNVRDRPRLGDILGKFFHAILLDRLDSDREQLEKINCILLNLKECVTPDQYRAICQHSNVRPVDTLSIFPSENISGLVDETVKGSYRSVKSFGVLERTILNILDTDPKRGNDLLSYFLFEETYLLKLLELGFEDARTKHDELTEFAENAIHQRPPRGT